MDASIKVGLNNKIQTGRLDVIISPAITAKLVKLDQIIKKETDTLLEMRRFTPRQQKSDVIIKISKKFASTPENVKVEFITKLERMKMTPVED